jgi:hypothetical protein
MQTPFVCNGRCGDAAIWCKNGPDRRLRPVTAGCSLRHFGVDMRETAHDSELKTDFLAQPNKWKNYKNRSKYELLLRH